MRKISRVFMVFCLVTLIVMSSIVVLSCIALSNEVNLISQRLPEVYGSANSDSFEINESKVRFASGGIANMEKGYDLTNTETKEFWSEKIIAFTDGNTGAGQYMRPEKSSEGDKIILVYRFALSKVSKIAFNIDGTRKKNVSVYFSNTYSDLFSNQANYKIDGERAKTFTHEFETKISCSYMAIVFEAADFAVKEIELYGTVEERSGNMVSGLTPVMYTSAKSGEFSNNGGKIFYNANSSDTNIGYAEGDDPSIKAFWADYTQKLTDDSKETSLYIKPEGMANNDRVIMVYSLPELHYPESFSLSFGAGVKNFKVYMSKNRNDLFSNMPVSTVFNFSADIYNDKLDASLVKYIGIVLEKPDYEFNDISFYGEKFEAPPKGENILKNAIPYFYGSTSSNSFDFNFTRTYYSETQSLHGYDKVTEARYSFWKDHLSKLTDQNDETNLYIKPERVSDNVQMVYSIEDCIINGFTIKTQSDSRKKVKIYASPVKSSLFQNLIFEADTYDRNIVDDGTIEIRAKYVAIVISAPDYYVSEVEVNANLYQRPDYGTNLIEGKSPHSLFLADRKYPLIPNGNSLTDISFLQTTLYNATDNDFSTSVEWKPTSALEKVNKNTRYLVTSFDLGDRATLSTLLIDSGLGGFDVYVADDYDSLFKSKENIVYTSNGDQLKADRSDLDPSTDLTPGELVIDLNGAKGRYIGFVVTRAQPVTVVSYEIVTINEIQVYGTLEGTDLGEDLIFGEAPIMVYRAQNSTLESPVGDMTPKGDMTTWTDNDTETGIEVMFPQVGGYVDYKYGSLVMIYYLQGQSDLNYFNMRTRYWYGIGGVDVYASNSFNELFDEENRAFTTGGTNATDEVYDLEYNLGAVGISGYFDEPVQGRYVAFVFTRICDSNVQGWAYLRLLEIEAFGNRNVKETLPLTTLTDKETGSTASFEYDNPDEKFVFGQKGIVGFKLKELEEKEYLTDIFKYSLARNGYEIANKAFVLEFYDKQGKLIDNSVLEGEKVILKLNICDESLTFLSEIRNGVPYLIKSAVKNGEFIDLTIDKFGSKYILLRYSEDLPIVENLSDGSILSDETEIEEDFIEDSIMEDNFIDNNEIDNIVDDEPKEDIQTNEDEIFHASEKKWKVVTVEDPLQWFWDIYDTFAANIWMLVICIVITLLLPISIVFGIIFYKKRRFLK